MYSRPVVEYDILGLIRPLPKPSRDITFHMNKLGCCEITHPLCMLSLGDENGIFFFMSMCCAFPCMLHVLCKILRLCGHIILIVVSTMGQDITPPCPGQITNYFNYKPSRVVGE